MNWFRYYTDTLDNPKVQELPGDLFKFWINLLCLARVYDGILPAEKTIAFRLRMPLTSVTDNTNTVPTNENIPQYISTTSCLHELEMRGLIDRTKGRQLVPHDWNEYQYVSDNSTDRVKKHRMKQERNVSCNVSRNVSVTPPEQNRTDNRAETEQSRGADAPRQQWKSDEPFVRFVIDYRSTGAPLIDEDFTEAYTFGWKPLDWEQKSERVKALAERIGQFSQEPAFVPKPVKFLKQEWKRPLRPSANGKSPVEEPRRMMIP